MFSKLVDKLKNIIDPPNYFPQKESKPLNIFYLLNPNQDEDIKRHFQTFFNVRYANGSIPLKYKILIGKVHKLIQAGSEYPYGAFAFEDVPKDEILAECTGLIDEDTNVADPAPHALQFKNINLDAKREGNFTRFINHSDHPNCKFEISKSKNKDILLLKTFRPIKQYEQLTVNYGYQYWKNKNRVFIQSHDNWSSPNDIYQKQLDHYESMFLVVTNDIKNGLYRLIKENSDKLIPKFNYPNAPILNMQHWHPITKQSDITLLHLYTFLGDIGLVLPLLINEADINLQCHRGRTALHYAVLGPLNELIKLSMLQLIIIHAQFQNINIIICPDDQDKTVYNYCVENNYLHCLHELLNLKLDFEIFQGSIESPIVTAVRMQNIDALDIFIEKISKEELKHHLLKPEINFQLNEQLRDIQNFEIQEKCYEKLEFLFKAPPATYPTQKRKDFASNVSVTNTTEAFFKPRKKAKVAIRHSERIIKKSKIRI